MLRKLVETLLKFYLHFLLHEHQAAREAPDTVTVKPAVMPTQATSKISFSSLKTWSFRRTGGLAGLEIFCFWSTYLHSLLQTWSQQELTREIYYSAWQSNLWVMAVMPSKKSGEDPHVAIQINCSSFGGLYCSIPALSSCWRGHCRKLVREVGILWGGHVGDDCPGIINNNYTIYIF